MNFQAHSITTGKTIQAFTLNIPITIVGLFVRVATGLSCRIILQNSVIHNTEDSEGVESDIVTERCLQELKRSSNYEIFSTGKRMGYWGKPEVAQLALDG